MGLPALSVALCTYNHAAYLETALRGVLHQSRAPDQVVVVDDASSDETPALLARLSAEFPQLEVHRNSTNQGVVASSARALAAARGELLYVAASDDYALPGAFAALATAFQRWPELGVAFGRMALMDASGREIGLLGPRQWTRPLHAGPTEYLRDLLGGQEASFSLCSATLWRREALEAIGGFRPQLGAFTDTFAMHALALRHGACFVPVTVAAWRIAAGGFARSLARDPLRALDMIERVAEAMRGPDMRSAFPDQVVSRWRADYRRLVITDAVEGFRRAATLLGDEPGGLDALRAGVLRAGAPRWANRLRDVLDRYPG